MSIENRPFVGTWQLNQKGVVRHTPDALVYINGNAEMPGCASCGGNIPIQRYITSITVDPNIQPPATASFSMQIPTSAAQTFVHDGEFLIKPGMEVSIYMRGYFPVKGAFSGASPDETGGVDVSNSVMYPYYHVFHGVITEASHEYSGGEHTASVSCSDILHFWQFQQISYNGSVFGNRPEGSNVRPSLIGHSFSGMTPYSIVYTLYRDVMGSAGGVGTALGGNYTNVAGRATETGTSLWSMAALYWEHRFSQHFNKLRMYSVSGDLYNAYEQAFLGRLSTKDSDRLVKRFSDPTIQTDEHDVLQGIYAAAQAIDYDPAGTFFGAKAEEDAKTGGLGVNVNQMQAFIYNVSNYGSLNFWESDYASKMDMISNVCELTNFEFYQDVDGDFVFKPPFYNLDTSSSRIYVIKDIDIISLSVSHKEPEYTVIKATATGMKNMGGVLEGEMGKRSIYVDFRLVAQFGWREQNFETNYLGDSKSMFYACVNRLDLYNIGIHSASCQIPIRPELRPGYPVYIEPLDCFFYLQSFNHSIQFGGQCTTSLNLVGRRAKFHAPGRPPEDKSTPTVENIYLNDPWSPALPLPVVGDDGTPRYQGFPNVVLAFDTELVNPFAFSTGINTDDLASDAGIQGLIIKVRSLGILELDEEQAAGKTNKDKWLTGPFKLRTGNDTYTAIPSVGDLVSQVTTYQTALAEVTALDQTIAERERLGQDGEVDIDTYNDKVSILEQAQADAEPVQLLIDAAAGRKRTAIDDEDETRNYFHMLGDLKASFSPGLKLRGNYRYYSSSHPDENMQGMRELVEDISTTGTTQAGGLIYLDEPERSFGFKTVNESNVLTNPDDEYGGVDVMAGIPIMRPNTSSQKDSRAVPTPTYQIGTIAFAQHLARKEVPVPRVSGKRKIKFDKKILTTILYPMLVNNATSVGSGGTVEERFGPTVEQVFEVVQEYSSQFLYVEPWPATLDDYQDKLKGGRVDLDKTVQTAYPRNQSAGVKAISKSLSNAMARDIVALFNTEYQEIQSYYGKPWNNASTGSLNASVETKNQVYDNLMDLWAEVIRGIAGDEVAHPASDDGSGLVLYVDQTAESAEYTPVFPVSDERGYEVIGSYRYGRGLSIEPGGSFQSLNDADPFANTDIDSVDEFILTLVNAGSPSKALTDLAKWNPEAAADIAATVTPEFSLSDVLEVIGAGGESWYDEQFRNQVVTSKDFTQKLTTSNTAYALAEITATTENTTCTCRGADAHVLLEAFGEDGYVTIEGLNDWMVDRATEEEVAWQASQDALRGQIEGSQNTLDDIMRAWNEATAATKAASGDIRSAVAQGQQNLQGEGD